MVLTDRLPPRLRRALVVPLSICLVLAVSAVPLPAQTAESSPEAAFTADAAVSAAIAFLDRLE